MSQLTNPYLAIILVPLTVFLTLIYIQTNPDDINLWGRGIVFMLLGYISARYVGRAPILAWKRDLSPEARNIVGWALMMVGFMAQISYGWIFIAYDRPVWLSSQYYGAAFVLLIGVGLAVVASSVPRLPPFGGGKNGLSELASFLVVVASAAGVFFVSHLPQVAAFFKGLFVNVATAL